MKKYEYVFDAHSALMTDINTEQIVGMMDAAQEVRDALHTVLSPYEHQLAQRLSITPQQSRLVAANAMLDMFIESLAQTLRCNNISNSEAAVMKGTLMAGAVNIIEHIKEGE